MKRTVLLLCSLWDKYWFPFVLGLFFPGWKLKLVSGKKVWFYWRSSCFKMKVVVCWLNYKPILCFLMTFRTEDIKTLCMQQKDLILFFKAVQIWPKLGRCSPVCRWLLLYLLERQKSPPQVQDLSLQRWGLCVGVSQRPWDEDGVSNWQPWACVSVVGWGAETRAEMVVVWQSSGIKNSSSSLAGGGIMPSHVSLRWVLSHSVDPSWSVWCCPRLATLFGGVPELLATLHTCLWDSTAI